MTSTLVLVFGLVTTGLCSALLLRHYLRVRLRLLLWSGLCFLGLTLATAVLIADLVFYPQWSLYTLRLSLTAAALALLLYGLIFESDR